MMQAPQPMVKGRSVCLRTRHFIWATQYFLFCN
jgi:hypothetical protein